MQFRRRVPRQSVGWNGICHIDGEPAVVRRKCRVVDISMLGLGITLHHPSSSELMGRHISVDVPAVGDSVSIRLAGKVTNTGLTRWGTVRLGIAFDRPSESELGIALVQSTMSERSGSTLSRDRGR